MARRSVLQDKRSTLSREARNLGLNERPRVGYPDPVEQHFLRLCRWDPWANATVLAALDASGGHPLKALAAFQHALAAELTWLGRIGGDPDCFMPLWGEPSLPLCYDWNAQAAEQLAALAPSLTSERLDATFHYNNSRGQPFSNPVGEVLLHMFMHSSQYRGEAAGLLSAAGHTVPDLDLIFWMRTQDS